MQSVQFEHESDPTEYRPTASLEILRARAVILSQVREFFDSRGYIEVETPLLSHDVVIDAHLDPFVVPVADGRREMFLQTSPEAGMKRLLAAGAEAIYQITRSFRRHERGRLHNPEFTILEWYRVGATYHDQMDCVEELVHAVAGVCNRSLPQSQHPSTEQRRMARHPVGTAQDASVAHQDPTGPLRGRFTRTTYDKAFQRVLGRGVLLLSTCQLEDIAMRQDVPIPLSFDRTDRDAWLNLLLSERVEPNLGIGRPEFLYDYPASQAALARIRADHPSVAERFELYVDGVELCNGYQELTEVNELRQRASRQNAIRERNGLSLLPEGTRLLAAMDAGVPYCSGVALGFDRLIMAALKLESIDQALPFPFEIA